MLALQQAIPNLTYPKAPIGKSDADNVEIARSTTQPPVFDFEPKDHVELGDALGLIDLEGGSRSPGTASTS